MRWKEITESRDWGVYYHGTSASFTGPPEPSISGVYGPGIYLTSDRQSALNYGGRGANKNVVAKSYRIAPGKLATDKMLSAAVEQARDEGFKAAAKYPRASQILAAGGFIGIKDGPIVVIFDKKNLTEFTPESASAGATGSASVATVVGGLGAGFDPNGDKGIYQTAKKPKKPMLIRRIAEGADARVLGDLVTIKTGMEDADFWIARRGSQTTVGKPTREYNPENIGIRVDRSDVIDPKYLYYVIEHLYNTGTFKQMATGTTNLVHISPKQVASIPLTT